MSSLPDDVYWAGRQREYLEQLAKDEADLARRLSKVYASEAAKLDRMIAAYYQQYGEGNVIEYRRLLQTISEADRTLLMERMDDFAAKYPQYAHLMPVRASIYRLNELEAIQWQIRLQQYEIGAIEQEELDAHFREQARRAANDAAEAMGFGKEFYSYGSEVVRETVGQAWASGKDFSERIWDNRERLAEYLNDDFSKAIARGVAYEVISKDLRDRLQHNGSKTAMRLVYTEGTFLFNEAHARVFSQDFQYYQLSCVHDGKTCEVCKALEAYQQGHPAIYDERKPGTNFPPMHPWCRCDTVPYVEDWQAWIDQYVADHGGDSATPPSVIGLASTDVSGSNGTDSLAKWTEDGRLNPSRERLHSAIVDGFVADAAVATGEKVFTVLGGGPAAGKSTMLKSGVRLPEGSVTVDPDAIKSKLPEYQVMLDRGNYGAANYVHEESSALSKRVMAALMGKGASYALDGTGDGSVASLRKKIDNAKAQGYRVEGLYCTVPTDVALDRARKRGEKTGRFINESTIRSIHTKVSQILPELAPEFDEVRLYDTTEDARLIATGGGGKPLTPVKGEEEAYRRFLAKGDE